MPYGGTAHFYKRANIFLNIDTDVKEKAYICGIIWNIVYKVKTESLSIAPACDG